MKNCKIATTILIFCLSLLMLNSFVVAHSGDTDSQGGHYNHSTNEYHYHHGHPAHQHNNGDCPYEKPSFFQIMGIIMSIMVIVYFLATALYAARGVLKKIRPKFKKSHTNKQPKQTDKEKLKTIFCLIILAVLFIATLVVTALHY